MLGSSLMCAEEAEAENKLVLRSPYIVSQDDLVLTLLAYVACPVIGILAGDGGLVYDYALLCSGVF